MEHKDIYSDEILVSSSSMIAGKLSESLSAKEMMADPHTPDLLKLWIIDIDLQLITVVSTNIGFTRTYSKRYWEKKTHANSHTDQNETQTQEEG